MEYRINRRTGDRISVIGLGASSIGAVGEKDGISYLIGAAPTCIFPISLLSLTRHPPDKATAYNMEIIPAYSSAGSISMVLMSMSPRDAASARISSAAAQPMPNRQAPILYIFSRVSRVRTPPATLILI